VAAGTVLHARTRAKWRNACVSRGQLVGEADAGHVCRQHPEGPRMLFGASGFGSKVSEVTGAANWCSRMQERARPLADSAWPPGTGPRRNDDSVNPVAPSAPMIENAGGEGGGQEIGTTGGSLLWHDGSQVGSDNGGEPNQPSGWKRARLQPTLPLSSSDLGDSQSNLITTFQSSRVPNSRAGEWGWVNVIQVW